MRIFSEVFPGGAAAPPDPPPAYAAFFSQNLDVFNQMLDLPIGGKTLNIHDLQSFADIPDRIAIADHCFACTAVSGSSCGGSLL